MVVVEALPKRPAKVASIQLRSGRQLLRVEDSLEALKAEAGTSGTFGTFGDAYLDVRVQTAGPVFGLSETVRAFLPNAVFVQAVYERADVEAERAARAEQSLTDAYAGYHASPGGHGVEAPEALLDTLRTIEEEVLRETP